jgi:hypothetical protein
LRSLPPWSRRDTSTASEGCELQTRAFVGDLRDDENLIVVQFHLAFLRFHNTS